MVTIKEIKDKDLKGKITVDVMGKSARVVQSARKHYRKSCYTQGLSVFCGI